MREAQLEELAGIILSMMPILQPVGAKAVAEVLLLHGYRKLPEKPKVLSGQEVADYFRSHQDEIQAVGARPFGVFRLGNQAQLEAAIKHIWGSDA